MLILLFFQQTHLTCCALASAESLSVLHSIPRTPHPSLLSFFFFFKISFWLIYNKSSFFSQQNCLWKRLRRASKLGFLTSASHVSIIYISIMQVSLRQRSSPGFCGRTALFDLCDAGTLLELTTENPDDTSCFL